MDSGADKPNAAHSSPNQVQRPTTVERSQLQASKPNSEDGFENVCCRTLHPAEIANNQVSSSCTRKRAQRGTNTCKQGETSPKKAQLMHLVRAVETENRVAGPPEAPQVHQTSPEGSENLTSKSSGKTGPPAQATTSIGVQSAEVVWKIADVP